MTLPAMVRNGDFLHTTGIIWLKTVIHGLLNGSRPCLAISMHIVLTIFWVFSEYGRFQFNTHQGLWGDLIPLYPIQRRKSKSSDSILSNQNTQLPKPENLRLMFCFLKTVIQITDFIPGY